MPAYREIDRCRICGNKSLVPILDLGRQALTGVFPKTRSQPVTAGPLELVRCDVQAHKQACGLVQLRQSYDKKEMYGRGYGYHSGLNRSMVDHLHGKVKNILKFARLKRGDLVVDIGSNDGTLLKGYPRKGLLLAGIDPTGEKFRKYYPPHVRLIADFFSAETVQHEFSGRRAKVVTSIAMFYDLDSPLDFTAQVEAILADDGIWVLEQSYLPSMLKTTAYDTICHEHLEYYGLRQIKWLADRAGFKILDVETNEVNGGSFSITLAKQGSGHRANEARIKNLLRREKPLSDKSTYVDFRRKVLRHREELRSFLGKAKKAGERVVGYGASTKGNVILQFCGLSEADIPCIGEVNRDKFGCYTPGTLIPIVSEREAKALKPHYLMVLPWHFKEFMLKKEAQFRRSGGRLFFPLPRLEIL